MTFCWIMLLFLFIYFFCSVHTSTVINRCPSQCVCMSQTIRCHNAGYRMIPKLPNIVPTPDGGALQFLTITENSIMRIEKSDFAGQLDLLRLELYSNQIVWISAEAFVGLPVLKSLVLRSNRLAYLPANVFVPIYKLEELDLSRNQLKHLPFSTEGLIYLKRLFLYGNPIHCPCEIIDFALSIIDVESKLVGVTCDSPAEVRGIRLVDLAKRLHSLTNHTKLLGYQTANDADRNRLIHSQPYIVDQLDVFRFWPWPHCPKQDFGGLSPTKLDDKTSTKSIQPNGEYNNIYPANKESQHMPMIMRHLESAKVIAGATARFVCTAEAASNSRINWLIPESAKRFIKLFRRRQILQINEVHDYHQGIYTCIVSNAYGVVTSEAILEIISPIKPTITYAPPADGNLVTEQSTLNLKCSARGIPKPTISWVWQKETLPLQLVTGGRYIVRTYDDDESDLFAADYSQSNTFNAVDANILSINEDSDVSSTLFVRNVTANDGYGRYICYISNWIGSARVSTVIQVTPESKVNENAIIWPVSENITMSENDTMSKEALHDSDELVRTVIENARKRVDAALKKTADRLRSSDGRRSSADIASLFRQPNRAALELAKAAEVYEAAIDEVTSILRKRNQTKINLNETATDSESAHNQDASDVRSRNAYGVELNSDQLAIIAQLSGCQSSLQIDPCTPQLCFHLRYRSIDGTCNNLNHPQWGVALAPFKRLLPPQYENGINSPIGWSSSILYFGYPKPSARLVSRELLGNATLLNKHAEVLKRLKKESEMDSHNNMMNMSDIDKSMANANATQPNDTINSNNNDNSTASNKVENSDKMFDEDDHSSGMLMQWGQFLDHDLDFTPVDASTSRYSDGLGCNETCVNDPPCFPILVPPNDPRIKHRCIGFARSSATCGSGSTSILLGRPRYREQLNQITAFIDASNVYGSDDFESGQLRETLFDEGKLREGMPTEAGKRLLPFNIRGQVDCQADPQQDFVPCFKAGDHRSNENLGLLSMHTLWLREHNRLVDGLRALNPQWSGDRMFQEARKIVGASMQAITYRIWLPVVLGPEGIKLLGDYDGYDDQVNPTISNAFATAAMRFGHTLVPPIVFRLSDDWEPIKQGHLLLHQAFFAPDRLIKDGGIDPLIRGLLFYGVRDRSRKPPLNSELTERLFSMAHELALDLAALNIQRGRDHGLPSYTEYAHKVCGLGSSSHPSSFDDLKPRIKSPSTLMKLRKVYGHPGNIDLFTGGILEELLPDARVGPTFACIIADQFKRLRTGDRFWYEAPGVFTPTQLAEIKRAGSSLSRVICENSDNITAVPENAFIRPKKKQNLVDCNRVPKLNLAVWKECPSISGFYDNYRGGSSFVTDTGRVESNERTVLHRKRRDLTDQQTSCIHSNQKPEMNIKLLTERIIDLEKQLNLVMSKVNISIV